MAGLPGFFDFDDRLKRLSDLGDQLEALDGSKNQVLGPATGRRSLRRGILKRGVSPDHGLAAEPRRPVGLGATPRPSAPG